MRTKALKSAIKWAIFALIIGVLLAFAVLPVYAMPGDDMDLNTFRVVQTLDYNQKLTYLTALAFQDYRQTESYQMENRQRGNYEVNPLLGSHPQRRDLQVFGLVGMTAMTVFAKYFPDGFVKRTIFDSVIASEQQNVREDRDMYSHRKNSMPIMIVATIQF